MIDQYFYSFKVCNIYIHTYIFPGLYQISAVVPARWFARTVGGEHQISRVISVSSNAVVDRSTQCRRCSQFQSLTDSSNSPDRIASGGSRSTHRTWHLGCLITSGESNTHFTGMLEPRLLVPSLQLPRTAAAGGARSAHWRVDTWLITNGESSLAWWMWSFALCPLP
jgi:hypothetical protein